MCLRINKVQKYSNKFWNSQYPTNSEFWAPNKQCMQKKKRQENMICNKKNQSTKTDLDMIEIMELIDKDIKSYDVFHV